MKTLRGLLALLCAGFILAGPGLTGTTLAQTAALEIKGRLVQGTADGPPLPPGLTVTLYALDSDGGIIATATTTSDAENVFQFDEVARAPGNTYIFSVTYADVSQGSMIQSIRGDETVLTPDITLYERTIDRTSIEISSATVSLNYATMNEFGLEVWLTLELVNYGDQIVTTNESAGPNNWQVSVVLTVPKDAFGVQPMQSTTSQRYVVETVDGVQVVKDTWPLRPGEPHKIVIAYYLPYHDRAVITHSFPDRVVDAAVLVPNDTIRFQSDQFDLEGEWRYRRAGDKYIPLPADVVVDPSTDFSLIKEHKLLAPLPPETPLIITLTGIAGGDADVTMLPPGLISGALLFNLMQLGNAEIQMIRLDDGQISTLASSPYAELCPHWSPDGTQIVFVSKRDSDPDIYGLTLGDGQVSRLTDKSGSEWSPVWSPDGSQIAFVADYIVNEDIYVIRADGSQRHLLTVSFSDDWNPAWSPDGTQIAFETTRDGNSEIYVMNADGSDPRNLTNNPANDWLPAWSPDGSQIAFVSMRDGNANIYVMNADGSGQHRLIDHPAGEYYPAWSPDGQWLAFTSNRTGATEIYVMALDSGALYRVTDAGVDNAWLSWQPAPAP